MAPAPHRPRPLGLPLAALRPLLLGALLIAGCDALDFRPSGENFVDVPLPTRGIAVDLSVPGDTLWAWGEAEIRYGVALQGKRFAAVEVFWGGQSLGITTDPHAFRFNSVGLGSGTRTLRLVAYAHSGTGSLADRLGAEFVVAEVRRVLVIQNHPPEPVQGLVAEPHEGRLRLRWTPHPHGTFQEYLIYEVDNNQPRFRAAIRDRRQCSWYDSLYVGGEASYQVAVIAAGWSAGATVPFSTPRPVLTAEPLPGRRVGLSWSPSPFHANITAIRVEMALNPPSGPIAELPGTASSYEHAPEDVFGAVRRYGLGFHGTHRSVWSTQAAVALDERRRVREVHYLPASGHLVALDVEQSGSYRPALLRLDPATGEEIAWAPLPVGAGLFASASGTRLFTREADRIREWDPHTLTPLREVAVRPLLGATALVGEAWATDGGVVFFTRNEELPGGGVHLARGVAVLDFDQGRIAATLPGDARALRSVSPSGSYLVVDATLYAFDGRALRFVRALPRAGVFVGEDRLAIPGPQGLVLLRFPEMTALHTYAAGEDVRYVRQDPASGLVSFVDLQSQPLLRVVDPEAGGEVYRVRVAFPHDYSLQNRALWGAGFYRPLSLPR